MGQTMPQVARSRAKCSLNYSGLRYWSSPTHSRRILDRSCVNRSLRAATLRRTASDGAAQQAASRNLHDTR